MFTPRRKKKQWRHFCYVWWWIVSWDVGCFWIFELPPAPKKEKKVNQHHLGMTKGHPSNFGKMCRGFLPNKMWDRKNVRLCSPWIPPPQISLTRFVPQRNRVSPCLPFLLLDARIFPQSMGCLKMWQMLWFLKRVSAGEKMRRKAVIWQFCSTVPRPKRLHFHVLQWTASTRNCEKQAKTSGGKYASPSRCCWSFRWLPACGEIFRWFLK